MRISDGGKHQGKASGQASRMSIIRQLRRERSTELLQFGKNLINRFVAGLALPVERNRAGAKVRLHPARDSRDFFAAKWTAYMFGGLHLCESVPKMRGGVKHGNFTLQGPEVVGALHRVTGGCAIAEGTPSVANQARPPTWGSPIASCRGSLRLRRSQPDPPGLASGMLCDISRTS